VGPGVTGRSYTGATGCSITVYREGPQLLKKNIPAPRLTVMISFFIFLNYQK